MSWFDYVGVCLGVAISLLASACALGRRLSGLSSIAAFQLCWRFALLQLVLLAAGWAVGVEAASAMAGWSCWIARLVVALVAVKMLWPHRASRSDCETSGENDSAMLLTTATSVKLHPLVLGFVLASLGCRSVLTALMAAMISSGLTLVGILGGARKGLQVAHRLQSAGGGILLLVLARGFFSHFGG